MTQLEEKFLERFGTENVQKLNVNANDMPLLLITFNNESNTKALVTNGLNEYFMNVPEKVKGREFNEIYFCLPSYWELQDFENPDMNWVFEWIQKLAKHVVSKNTWFGSGHTIPCGNPFQALSPKMKQNHFFLCDPILLKEELQPFVFEDKTIYMLGIIPIFEEEMDYKQGKGTVKLLQKLNNHGVTEKLDNYRGTVMRSKWKLFRNTPLK
ncbi:MAG: suppressor of fused domain protein [Flavobacteriia bacterium]|nr:suppressor of fused domain protein [Flavobacteriia bacterium]